MEVENLVPPQSGNESNRVASRRCRRSTSAFRTTTRCSRYWDTVADRLYKIRHCMNIEGVVRQLDLFEPPIDPGALVKAVAGGVDIGVALADLNAPLPLYRFNVLLQKANEVCNDVKALGAALLAALEKNDAEGLALLRQSQEIQVLEAVKDVRQSQLDEANENLEGARRSKELAQIKKQYYESREFMNAGETVAVTLTRPPPPSTPALRSATASPADSSLIPDFVLGASGFGGSPHAVVDTGGKSFGDSADDLRKTLESIAKALDKGAALSSTLGSYQRRQDDWNFQRDLAAKEIEQLDRQITAADLRVHDRPERPRQPGRSDRQRQGDRRLHALEVHEPGALPVAARADLWRVLPELQARVRASPSGPSGASASSLASRTAASSTSAIGTA